MSKSRSTPVTTTIPPARVSLTPAELAEATAHAQEALSLSPLGTGAFERITSPADNQSVVDFLRDRLDPAIDFCNSLFNPILAAIDQLRATTQQSRQQLVGPLADLKTRLRAALQAWDNHLREIQRQIDADRAAEVARLSREILEQDRLAKEQEALDKANELLAVGKEDDATQLLDSFFGNGGVGFADGSPSPTYTLSLPSTKAGSRADGQSSSTLRRARVLDIDKLKPEYVDRSPNLRKIQAMVTKHGKQAEELVSADGKGGAIEYYEKGSVTIRKRRTTNGREGSEEYDEQEQSE